MKGKLDLPRELSIDSGVVLAYFLGEERGKIVKAAILPPKDRKVYSNRVAVSELFYILCRRRSEEFAHEATEALLKSGYISMISSDELDIEAGRYKCARGISLADCYVIALAKILNITALFARREEDLKKELAREAFDVKMLFLEDLTK